MNFGSQKAAHLAYRFGVYFKGLDGLLEIGGGVALLCVPNPSLRRLVGLVTQEELVEDPDDFIATHLVTVAQHFSIHTQHFAGIYLLGHGLIKVCLVVGLLRKVTWSYPTALITLMLFIAYQVYTRGENHFRSPGALPHG